MVRSPSVEKNGLRKGAWTEEEDNKLRAYVQKYGHRNWRQLPRFAGLSRCGKSCRLRWLNYLRPGLKRGNYSQQEEELIIKLREELGNKWAAIAEKLPGRSDNEIKNYWHIHLKGKMINDPKLRKSTEKRGKISHPLKVVPKQNQQLSKSETEIVAADDDANASFDLTSTSFNSTHLGCQGFGTEDSSMESFGQTFESFWTEPFSLDTSCNSTFSDSLSSANSLSYHFESFWSEPFSSDVSYNQSIIQSPTPSPHFDRM